MFLCPLLALAIPSLALDRNAFSFPHTELQVTLGPHEQSLAAEGTVELRNISRQPQTEAALQISSSLQWLSVLVNDESVEWLTQSYTSDIDHTGVLSEAILRFAHPVAPGETVRLSVRYSGAIVRDATRLERIGTPRQLALRSDWDQIGDSFTALRGVGYVVWYPAAMEAANLSQGDELFEMLRNWRERESGSTLRVKLRLAPSPSAQGVAGEDEPSRVFVGSGKDLAKHTDPPLATESVAQTDSAATNKQEATLDQEFRGQQPVIALLSDAGFTARPAVDAYYTVAHTGIARDYMAATEAVMPPLEEWFGKPKSKVVVVELPDAVALPYTAGRFYFTPLRKVSAAEAQVEMARVVAGALFESPRPWVNEGLAGFAQALIRERQAGRRAALALLGQWSPALVQAEAQSHAAGKTASPEDPPTRSPQPLVLTTDEIFLRTKAAYVWWMLRDMAGDRALQAALAAYRASDDRDTGYVQRLIEQHLSPHISLESFFDEWVYRDRGLPRLRIASAYARTTLGKQTVTAVTVENLGEVGCEVPVFVRSSTAEARARLLVPANGKVIVRVPLDATPTEAEVNDGSVPEPSRENHVVTVTTPISAQ